MSTAIQVTWTELSDKSGKTMTTHTGSYEQVIERVRNVGTFPGKEHCPWFKFASFGNKRTANGSLRSNDNLTAVYGVEGDYDGEKFTMEQAIAMLERYGIKALLYPSPSSTPSKPRWRIVCPLAKPQPPKVRAALVARLNGALGGILAGESFTLSQGYYFGATPTNDYRVLLTFDNANDGFCIDDLDELDSIAIGKSEGKEKHQAEGDQREPTESVIQDELHAPMVKAILDGTVYHANLRDLAASWVANGMHCGAVVNLLRALMDASQASHDDRWKARRAQIPALVSSASAKFAPPTPVDISGLLANISTKGTTAGETVATEPRFKLLTADDLRTLPPLRWRVRGVLPAVGLVALYGPSGCGKSFLALDLAIAIAEGRCWFKCRVQPATVLYICLEGEAGFSLRAQAWEARNGRKVPDGVRMMVQPFDLTDLGSVHELASLIPPSTVVFVDTLNRAAPTADENSSKDMGEILQAAKLLQSLIKGLVVLVHHTGKDSTRGLRGHSSLFAACDAVMEVVRGEAYREWRVSKSKDGADGCSNSFDLEVIELGNDEFGDAITSCVVVQDQDAEPREKPLTEHQSDGLSSFHSAAVLLGLLNSAGEFDGLHVDQWRDEFYAKCTAVSVNAKRVAFQRVRKDLVKLGRLTANTDIYRLAGVTSGIQNKLIADAIRKRQASSTPAQ